MATPEIDAARSAADIPDPDRHLPFYGLASAPFRAGSDPSRLWLCASYRRVIDELAHAVEGGRGVALLSGEGGTGKTSLAQRMIAHLDPARHVVGYVANPAPAPSDFFESVLSAFGVRRLVHGREGFLAALRDLLARAAAREATVLLVVDEAQNLGLDLLREIEVMIESSAPYRFVVLLIGESRVVATLDDERLAPLREHVVARLAVPPLGPEEVGAYIRHSLEAAGALGAIFTQESIRRIAVLSRGAPGAINIIADRALLVGRAQRAKPITPDIVDACGDAMHTTTPIGSRRDATLALGGAARARRSRGRGRLYVTIAATALLVTGAPYLAWRLTGLGDDSARTVVSYPVQPAAPAADAPAPAPAPAPDASATAAATPEPDRPSLPDRAPRVSSEEAHAAPTPGSLSRPARELARVPQRSGARDDAGAGAVVPRRESASATRPYAAPRESPIAREAVREVRPPAPVASTPRPTPVAPAPSVAAPSAPAPSVTAPEPARSSRTDGPDPSAVIDWLMKSR